ncbi:MAG: amidohydrolase [Ruminococcaceae bacterium]|nr:amidohydrolase [Oscillospiraceae bacterium]
MIYDSHAHLIVGRIEQSKAMLVECAEIFNISKIFISTLDLELPNPSMDQVEYANGETFKFKKEHPELIEGYVYVSPEHKNAIDTVRRGMEDCCASGAKLWMATECDDARVNPIVEKMIEYNAPILIHTFHKAAGQLPRETTAANVARLARRYPEAKFIMAHLGGNAYYSMPPIRSLDNVWVDLCSSIYRGDELMYTLETIGEDRLLFGSDTPAPMCCRGCIGQVEELEVSQEIKDKIFYLNSRNLFEGRKK